uniref:Uncharacterized protein n=2 Tax=Babesia bovis TaxID=5865 RepID=A7AMH5_BABBO|eukprot:XP_001611327.1 hypothetical protein [Babesia bovis T2Bo]
MTGAGYNSIQWNHIFVMDIDDIWVDLNLIVRAEMDFNQFSQQQHGRHSMSRSSTGVKLQKNTSQVSRGETVPSESADEQHLESVYGKTKYVQRIGRAILSVPMLLDSLEVHSTDTLRESSAFSHTDIPTDDYETQEVPSVETISRQATTSKGYDLSERMHKVLHEIDTNINDNLKIDRKASQSDLLRNREAKDSTNVHAASNDEGSLSDDTFDAIDEYVDIVTNGDHQAQGSDTTNSAYESAELDTRPVTNSDSSNRSRSNSGSTYEHATESSPSDVLKRYSSGTKSPGLSGPNTENVLDTKFNEPDISHVSNVMTNEASMDATQRKNSSDSASGLHINPVDGYPYFVETIATLQMLPFHEHKWDDSKFVKPSEGYPSYGMKAPTLPLGYIDIRVRIYLKNKPQLLALLSCRKPPRHFWRVPAEFEMFHTSMIVKRMAAFINEKPRWINHMLLPTWPYKHPFYILAFWIIVLDAMVFAPLPRIVLDFYALLALVAIYYRLDVGPMKYYGLCDTHKEAQNVTRDVVEDYSDIKGISLKNLTQRRTSINPEEETPEILSSRSENHATQVPHMNVKRADSDSRIGLNERKVSPQRGHITLKRSSSKIITPTGYREVGARRYKGGNRWAIFADDLEGTNLEDIVKNIINIMLKVQLALGYVIMALDKLKYSLGCTDSLSWLMALITLACTSVPICATAYVIWKVPTLAWRLGFYIIVAIYCFTYYWTDEILIVEVIKQIFRLIKFNWVATHLKYWYQRAPDSREAEHRATTMLQITRN